MSRRKFHLLFRVIAFRGVGDILFTFQVKKLRPSLPPLTTHPPPQCTHLNFGSVLTTSLELAPQRLPMHSKSRSTKTRFPTTVSSAFYNMPWAYFASIISHYFSNRLNAFVLTHTVVYHPTMSVLMLFLQPGISLRLFHLLKFYAPFKIWPTCPSHLSAPARIHISFLCAPQNFTLRAGSYF